MEEKKLTDEEIVKDIERSTGMPSYWKKIVLDLIHRLQSENATLESELKKELDEHEEFTKKAKAEIERVKEKFSISHYKDSWKNKFFKAQEEIERLKAFKDEAISLSLYEVGLKDGKALAEKDTAKEIFGTVKELYIEDTGEFEYTLFGTEIMRFAKEKYGVEVK